jgi:MoaA/NifB/PqqE/SkfB family radical SAM enzyme
VPGTWIAFHVSERCGLACLHCLRDPAAEPAELTAGQIAGILDEAVRVYGVEHVGLTGGEPAIHPELGAIVGEVARRGLRFHVIASGLGFDRLLAVVDGDAAARGALSCVHVSVDGGSAATHDAIRGPGSYRRAMAAVAACHAREIPFAIQLTVNAVNRAELQQAGLAAAQLGAERFLVGMTQATGTPEDARLALPVEEWERVAVEVERLAGVLQLPVVANEGFPRRQPFHTCSAFAGEVLHVDAHGRLSLCCQHSGVPGDGGELSVDLAQASLAEAHGRLLDVVHRYQRERLAGMDAGRLGPWDLFSCNACLRRFGKPHWTDAGAAGPRARRGGREGQG